MSVLDDLRYLALRLGLPVTTTCPLCIGTDREPLTYEPDQLAEHAIASHDFEAVYDFTRRMADLAERPELVGMIDAAFDVVTELTTSYDDYYCVDEPMDRLPAATGTTRETVADVRIEWGWTCERCSTTRVGFNTEQDAREHRRTHHRCPA